MRALATVIAICALSSSALAGNVLVVGPGPGQLAEIQAGVDAALDGDVILVKSGTYQSFLVVNKEISIVADVGQTVNVTGAIRARGLTADRTLVIAGLHATGHVSSSPLEGDGMYLKNCSGFVRVQDCTLAGFQGGAPCGTTPRHGAEIEGCAAVSFERCTLRGARVDEPGQTPWGAVRQGDGLVATGSGIALDACSIRGGEQGLVCNGYSDGGNGGHGCVLTSSFLFAAKSELRGGDGTNTNVGLAFAGSGGNGLVAVDTATAVHVLDSQLIAGMRGTNYNCGLCGTCCWGDDGAPYSIPAGSSIDFLPGTGRTLSAASVARESTALALTIGGVAGDIVALRIDRRPAFAFDPGQFGTSLVAAPTPARWLILGTVPSSSVLNATLPLLSIPASDPGRTFYLQTLHTDVNGQHRLGSPLTLVVLDSAY